MAETLSILMLEDCESDAQLIELALRRGGLRFSAMRVATGEAFLQALEQSPPDLILSDYRLPGFDGRRALRLATQKLPTTPVIIVTGALVDTDAVELLREGAADYVLKDRLSRLVPAVQAALAAAIERRERRNAERSASNSELRYRRLFEAAQEGIVIARADDGVILDVNPFFVNLLGYPASGLLGKPFDVLPSCQDDLPAIRAAFGELQVCDTINGRFALRHSTGATVHVEVVASAYEVDGLRLLQCSLRDITARVRAEEREHRANRALAALSESNQALIRATEELPLLQEICRIVVEHGGYRMVCVGYAQDDAQKSVHHIAYAGDWDTLPRPEQTWGDGPLGQGPSGSAIRTGVPQVLIKAQTDVAHEPWRVYAVDLGYHSVLGLPLCLGAKSLGALCIYSTNDTGFDAEELKLLSELAEDLAFGVTTLRARANHERGVQQLQAGMEAAIAALATTLEMRDTYTAGHQRRVSELAAAIARELGFSENDVHGIGLAAQVHDLGKITVPIEILTKPTPLTRLEFQMIMVHAQAGYEILKDVDFPWPIADMVRQHHERMDGSGYPQGLLGDAILPGARVLAVADTVEAMCSMRPYRAALGIDKALATVEAGRDRLYDADVADACLRLFREGRFAFTAPEFGARE